MNRTIPDGSWTQLEGTAIPDPMPLTEADIPLRRIVLRGAFAVGCSLLLPASLLGCSKKEESTAGTEPPASSPAMDTPASPAPLESAAPAAPAKASQASVQYQSQPKDDKTCADCMYFVAESNTCTLVEGDISPAGWCILWVKKA